ncbi:MAG: DUF3572 domain-containing protein [Pseudomonadota bacterium]
MTPEAGETLALKALMWLLDQDDLRGIFMGSAGLSADDVKAGAADPVFLASVLDFLCMDDGWVTAFCDSQGVAYTDPMMARAALPGGQEINWT